MKLCIGTAQFGLNYGIANVSGQVSSQSINDILELAWNSGVKIIDTAVQYGNSEKLLGNAGVSNFKIISKLPKLPDSNLDVRNWVNSVIKTSLDNLRVNQLYGLLLHHPLDMLSPRGNQLLNVLLELKQDRLVNKIGITIYEPCDLENLNTSDISEIIQCPYNVLDRRLANSKAITKLKKNGSEIHIRSVFLQGLLLMTPENIPEHLGVYRGQIDLFQKWANDNGMTALQACIRHVMSNPHIDQIVVGIDYLEHLEEILQVFKGAPFEVPNKFSTTKIELIDPRMWKNDD